jgi:hypothetical protein
MQGQNKRYQQAINLKRQQTNAENKKRGTLASNATKKGKK